MIAKSSRSLKLANFFGILGYVSLCLQWIWICAAFLPALLENKSVREFVLPSEQATPVMAPTISSAFSPLLLLASLVITLVVIVVAVILLIRLPIAIAKTGSKASKSTAKALVPLLTHRRNISQKKKRMLSASIIRYGKFLASLAPIILLMLFEASASGALSVPTFVFIEAIATIGTLIWFSAQYVAAAKFNIHPDKLL